MTSRTYDGRVSPPALDDLFDGLHVVALPMRVRFRGITTREVALIEGPAGWGEFGAFPEYADTESAHWLASAIESAYTAPPPIRRDHIPINATVPAVPADALPAVLDQAQAEGWTLTQALEHLLRVEVTATDARRLAGRFRFANLPTGQTLDDFDHDAASGIDRSLLAELGTCRFIDTATNVLLIGPPGVGKTHIATGLGHAAVTAGYRVYFTSAADLAARCHRAAIEGKWSTMMRFFAGHRRRAGGRGLPGDRGGDRHPPCPAQVRVAQPLGGRGRPG